MKAFRITTILLFLTILSFSAKAQIGYQVSLLNNATGEPRANESVNVTVKITDSAGNVICEQTKHETTNDFGILSMSVGNADTFADADWSKLPFFIEATIDGRLIGRSQLLSVPVAEHAKHTGTLTKEILCSKTWKHTTKFPKNPPDITDSISFDTDGTFRCSEDHFDSLINLTYEINGNIVIIYGTENLKNEREIIRIQKIGTIVMYSPKDNSLIFNGAIYE